MAIYGRVPTSAGLSKAPKMTIEQSDVLNRGGKPEPGYSPLAETLAIETFVVFRPPNQMQHRRDAHLEDV